MYVLLSMCVVVLCSILIEEGLNTNMFVVSVFQYHLLQNAILRSSVVFVNYVPSILRSFCYVSELQVVVLQLNTCIGYISLIIRLQ